mmetsp:Transcript_132575/g.243746  ORF Transcript_132575/g.243746 Transcript_132575/m.243746 type:complete len:85 (-) Transcript_132575:163-417(-)
MGKCPGCEKVPLEPTLQKLNVLPQIALTSNPYVDAERAVLLRLHMAFETKEFGSRELLPVGGHTLLLQKTILNPVVHCTSAEST